MMNTGMEQIYVIDNIFQIHQDGNTCVKSEVQVPNDCGTGIQLQTPIYADLATNGNVVSVVQSPSGATTGATLNGKDIVWNRLQIHNLVDEYRSNIELFRDTKTKKKDVWRKIQQTFEARGFKVTPEQLDKKFRNLKQSYSKIKEKQNQNGSKLVAWEYYQLFEDLLDGNGTCSSSLNDMNATGVNTTMQQMQHNVGGGHNNNNNNNINNNNSHSGVGVIGGLQSIDDDNPRGGGVGKTRKNRHLERYRKRIIELEEIKIDEIKKLRESVEKLQGERNKLLRDIITSINSNKQT